MTLKSPHYIPKQKKKNVKRKKQLYREKEIKSKCVYCGKTFTKKRFSSIYCSKKCKKEVYNKRYKQRLEDGNFTKTLKLRFEILKRDGFKCCYCGRNPKEDNCKLEIDHIIPSKKGGKNLPENLITSCRECNLGKSDVLLQNCILKD